MTAAERKALSADLAARSAQVRSEQVEARREAQESARKGLRALLGERLEAKADEITARLERLALSPDDGVALQGLKLWLERVHGRAVQPTQEVAPSLPADIEALHALTPEERRELLRALA